MPAPDAAILRPMRAEDAGAVEELKVRTFDELDERSGRTPPPHPTDPARIEAGLARHRHLVATDPGGAWVAERDGRLVGTAIAILRDGLWGLSLLIVDPVEQSSGIGSRLLSAALGSLDGARGGVILASEDPRALRVYAKAGFALHPSLGATGVPRAGLTAPEGVRGGDGRDLPLADTVDLAVRGVPHGADLRLMLEHGQTLLVVPGRGYACVDGGEVRVLAALDEPAAVDLLRAAIAGTPDGKEARVDWITSAQGWAVPVVVEAGMKLELGGAVCVRGEVGPFTPYLPSGAYL